MHLVRAKLLVFFQIYDWSYKRQYFIKLWFNHSKMYPSFYVAQQKENVIGTYSSKLYILHIGVAWTTAGQSINKASIRREMSWDDHMYHHPNWQPRWISVHLMSVLKRFGCILILEKLIGSACINLKSNAALTYCRIAWQGTFIRRSGYWSSY